ncbi:hypothetical protein PQD80_gp45 [Arthrobacter phage Lizalica]|uniref:Uncharacterized protein n=1 Tax=Arthrobacter phage Lizalica TaxID=2832319 RepID=A0AA48Y425_9CAUD|nr:hypothetical protein PQD80_gp45 [Arthrobacter phage Lizalica]UIW13529.1 hypothetical protein SEA_LIZALICA_45 [Arthrobacter phage Lizalica]
MALYCLCGECKVRDMQAGITPWCIRDIDRGPASEILGNLFAYVERVGKENYDSREYVTYRREQMGLPASEREEWLRHLEGLDREALGARQKATLDGLLKMLREEDLRKSPCVT